MRPVQSAAITQCHVLKLCCFLCGRGWSSTSTTQWPEMYLPIAFDPVSGGCYMPGNDHSARVMQVLRATASRQTAWLRSMASRTWAETAGEVAFIIIY